MILDSLRYPLSGDRPYRTLGVGALLSTLGLLVLPALFVTGYYGKVLEASSRDEPLPAFDDWGALFEHGLLTWIAIFLYVCIALLGFVVVGVLAFALAMSNTGGGRLLTLVAFSFLGAAPLLVLFLPAWFFVPALLTNFAREGNIGATFDLGTVWNVAFDRRYVGRWFLGLCLFVVGAVAYGLLGSWSLLGVVFDVALGESTLGSTMAGGTFGVPFVGHVVGVCVNFYCEVAAFYCFGRGYAAAAEIDDESQPVETASDDATSRDEVEWGLADDEWGGGDDNWGHDRPEGVEWGHDDGELQSTSREASHDAE